MQNAVDMLAVLPLFILLVFGLMVFGGNVQLDINNLGMAALSLLSLLVSAEAREAGYGYMAVGGVILSLVFAALTIL